MRYQRVAVGVVFAAGLCAAQVNTPAGAKEYTISADVDRVVLPATVLDRKNRVVADLTKNDFRVFDDGRLQEIRDFSYRDLPLTVGLIVDNSSSMGPKRSSAILAALNFVRLSNPADEVFVVDFNEKVTFGLARPFSADPQQLGEALVKLPCAGRTALYDAVMAATEHLSHGSRDKKALIIISDGGDNASSHRLRQAIEAIGRSQAIVYAIGLFDADDPDRNPAVLKQLARPTGGEVFFPESPRELPAILAHVARTLRSQYTLTYAPANEKHDGRYHRVRVIAASPGQSGEFKVRSRTGYYAPAANRTARGASE